MIFGTFQRVTWTLKFERKTLLRVCGSRWWVNRSRFRLRVPEFDSKSLSLRLGPWPDRDRRSPSGDGPGRPAGPTGRCTGSTRHDPEGADSEAPASWLWAWVSLPVQLDSVNWQVTAKIWALPGPAGQTRTGSKSLVTSNWHPSPRWLAQVVALPVTVTASVTATVPLRVSLAVSLGRPAAACRKAWEARRTRQGLTQDRNSWQEPVTKTKQ